jgi:putative molybdopterin biosynthesis protein
LLDYRLRRLGLPGRAISGYDQETTTHTATAHAVAGGQADVGLGLRAAADAFGLDFIPVARERYDLVTLAEWRTLPPLAWLLDTVSSPGFKSVVATLGGYDVRHTGEETEI